MRPRAGATAPRSFVSCPGTARPRPGDAAANPHLAGLHTVVQVERARRRWRLRGEGRRIGKLALLALGAGDAGGIVEERVGLVAGKTISIPADSSRSPRPSL